MHGARRWLPFVADVWAAKTLLKASGIARVTPTRIASWLIDNGRAHGYAETSVRLMVYKALESIKAFESAKPIFGGEVQYWRPVDL
jgi:hypothetical protein